MVEENKSEENKISLNSEEWKYLAEGNQHLLLEYVGEDEELKVQLLRFNKKEISNNSSEN